MLDCGLLCGGLHLFLFVSRGMSLSLPLSLSLSLSLQRDLYREFVRSLCLAPITYKQHPTCQLKAPIRRLYVTYPGDFDDAQESNGNCVRERNWVSIHICNQSALNTLVDSALGVMEELLLEYPWGQSKSLLNRFPDVRPKSVFEK